MRKFQFERVEYMRKSWFERVEYMRKFQFRKTEYIRKFQFNKGVIHIKSDRRGNKFPCRSDFFFIAWLVF